MSRTTRNAVIAAVVGVVVGTIAGLSTIPQRPATAAAATTFAQSVPVAATPPSTLPSPSTNPTATEQTRPVNVDRRTVLERARDFSDRADVTALIALREEVSKRAVAGQPAAPAVNELAEIDRFITVARAARLKRDGEALQNQNPSTR